MSLDPAQLPWSGGVLPCKRSLGERKAGSCGSQRQKPDTERSQRQKQRQKTEAAIQGPPASIGAASPRLCSLVRLSRQEYSSILPYRIVLHVSFFLLYSAFASAHLHTYDTTALRHCDTNLLQQTYDTTQIPEPRPRTTLRYLKRILVRYDAWYLQTRRLVLAQTPRRSIYLYGKVTEYTLQL